MRRLITGALLLLLGVYVLGNGGLPLFCFLSMIGWLAFYEVRRITELKSVPLMIINIGVYQGFMFLIFFDPLPVVVDGLFLSAFLMTFSIMLYEFSQKSLLFRNYLLLNNAKFFLYIFIGFSSIYMIRESYNGLLLTVLMFLSVWATDVFAYYGGKRFGVRPLSSISPNKTKEGTIIGLFSAIVLVGVASLYFGYPLWMGAIAGIIGMMAQLGDLYESLIKRTYQVKDSSNLLPGHGGILDRADSSLFVAPMVHAMVIILG